MLKIKTWIMVFALAMTAMPVLVGNALAVSSTYNTINSETLGVTYGAYTGLGSRDVRRTVASIINVALGLLGIVAVVIILIGGFTWMTAGGNDEKVTQARKWIFSGIIGLAIILSAYALASWVIEQLVQATSS